MTNILYNPFTNRSLIRNEHEFIGLEQEITNILSRVRNGDAVSRVGIILTIILRNQFKGLHPIKA